MTAFQKSIRMLRHDPVRFLRVLFSRFYNAIAAPSNKSILQSDSHFLNEIAAHAQRTRTDISDHLTTLFIEALAAKPRLIVELGVRGGESTFVLERVARLTNAKLVSADIEDCSGSSSYADWTFVQMDDIAFARTFPSWCAERNITPEIDVLFIDTSHLYDHTVQEIESWFPLTSSHAKVLLHDTNMRSIYFRRDGSMGVTRNNNRGVIAALEQHFQKKFDERTDFVDYRHGWLIRHFANSSGLTVLEKTDLLKN